MPARALPQPGRARLTVRWRWLQVLEGPDGAKALGWPAFHKSHLHASPLLYDVDLDGVRDILVATYDGEILAFKDTVRGRGRGHALGCDSPPGALTHPRLPRRLSAWRAPLHRTPRARPHTIVMQRTPGSPPATCPPPPPVVRRASSWSRPSWSCPA